MLTTIKSGLLVREDLELSDEQVTQLNRCPIDDVIRLLDRLWKSSDRNVTERAFNAFRRLDGLDQVEFLASNLKSCPDRNWRGVCCSELAKYQGPRAIAALCDALVNDEDGDVRYDAAWGLKKIGDASALPALDHAVWHDIGTDWEGRIIAQLAWKVARRIRGEPGARRPIKEWMAEQQLMPLREIVASLNTLPNHLTIEGKRGESWNADSLMLLVPPTEHGHELYHDYQLRYLNFVPIAKQLVNSWSDGRSGQIPNVEEACELLVEDDRKREAENRASDERREARLQELAREREGREDEPFDASEELDDLPF